MPCKPIGRASTSFPYSWNTYLLVKQFGKKNLTLHGTRDGHWKAKEESISLRRSTDPQAPRTEISNPSQYPGCSLTHLIYKYTTYNAQFPRPHQQLHTDTFTPLYLGRCICLLMGLPWRNLRLLKGKGERAPGETGSVKVCIGAITLFLCLPLHLESFPSDPCQGSCQDIYFTAKAHPAPFDIAQL